MGIFPPLLSDIMDTSPFFFNGLRGFRESMNIQEDQLVVTVALPGFGPEEVSVHAEAGNALVITAHSEGGEDEAWTADYSRRLVLPRGYVADEAVAAFKSGLLKVTVGRTSQPQGKKIAISTGDKHTAIASA